MAAPWRAAFTEHVAQLKSPTFVLSTLHAVSGHSNTKNKTSSSNNSAAAAPLPYLPRARTVVFRGMWASLPANDKNPAPRNPPAYESDLLAVTTDVRMDKVPDLLGSTGSKDSDQRSLQGGGSSGGGGPVEAVFWVEATNTQWRLRGTAYVLGPDIGSDAAAAQTVREKLLSRMRPLSSSKPVASSDDNSKGKDDSWSWERELTAHFGNLSPLMRGSFRNPPPGTPLDGPNPPDPELRLGQRVEDLHDPVARANFRVVVVVPREVDRVDLSDAERPRRWLYRYMRGDSQDDVGYLDADMSLREERQGDWEVLEVWP